MRSHGSVRLAAVLALAAATSTTRAARAEEPNETADSPLSCRAFEAKNAREREEYERKQTPTPYTYPRDENVLGAPWGKLFDALGGPCAWWLVVGFGRGMGLRGAQSRRSEERQRTSAVIPA